MAFVPAAALKLAWRNAWGALVVPRPGVPDDYVVMVVVHDAAGDAHLVVASPALEELARATLPEGGVPYGFHSCWIPAA